MNYIIWILIIALILLSGPDSFAGEYVNGYWKDTNHDGIKDTYVQPYQRSEKNNSLLDNYSTKGNINPYTGKEGTVDPYKVPDSNPYSTPYSKPYLAPYSNPYGK